MKFNLINRATAMLLITCILISCMTVLPSFAATTSSDGVFAEKASETDPNVLQVLLNRDFEDGKMPQNGGNLSSSGAINAIKMVTSDGNTYLRYTSQGAHDYIYYSVGNYAPNSGSVVMQMDVMVEEDGANIPGMIQLNPNVRGAASDIYQLAAIRSYSGKSHLMSLSKTPSAANQAPMTAGEWYTLTFVWSYESKDEVLCTVYNGATKTLTYTDTTAAGAEGCTDVRPGQVRVGTTGNASGTWCLDNVIIYTTYETSPEIAGGYNIASDEKGALYAPHGNSYIDPELFDGTCFFKLGSTRALDTSETVHELVDAPFAKDGTVYLPVSALEEVGIAVSSLTESVNGIRCVALDNINSATGGLFYSAYSNMGLIGICSSDELSFDGLTAELLPTMQKFLFDNITPSLTNAESFSVSDMTTTAHPYLFADQNRFNELAAAYASGSGELYSYLSYHASQAANVYKNYATVSNNTYSGIKSSSVKMPYTSAYGYDVGGRLNEAASHNSRILTLAFGYQITGNSDYARLAYDYAIAMGQWEHWGPGHFLNCADASAPYSTAYDWLYNAWVELGLDVNAIEQIIFTHSILPAYYSIHDNGCPWYDPKVSSGWGFKTSSNNWNAVCSSGVTVASLALVGSTTASSGTMLDITVDGVYSPDIESYAGTSGTITRKDGKSFTTNQIGMDTYRDYCEYIINQCLYNLPMYGMVQYAPDGSYIESNSYWSYGTNNFFKMTAALTSATGSDYGLLDTWGLDRTAYFALNTQSGDYKGWNYHDSNSTGAQDTSWFIYLGTADGLDDKALAGLRKRIISQLGSRASMYDAIYYMSDEEIGEYKLPDIQYYMEGIDGYVVRDSWDKESIYGAIMGNGNNVSHGQIDSGSFVYHNGGTIWFCDVGTENYNTYGFWNNSTRYTYYKMNAEGNNTLVLTSQPETVPYGQTFSGFGYMTDTYNNEYGAYTVIDNTTAYGGYAASAKRGMLFTNDRRTLVIQDEVIFKSPESAVWVAHTEEDVMLSVDGKTAYMYDGKNVLKVTLVDNNSCGLKFEITDTYDFLLDATVGPDFTLSNGGVAENDRSSYKRLIIRCENVTSINLAVVIEEVAVGETMNGDIGYEWCTMDSWAPTVDGRLTNTVLGSFEFEKIDTGSVSADVNTTLNTSIIGSNNALTIIPGTDSEVIFKPLSNKVEYGSFGRGKVSVEFDLYSPSSYPAGTAVQITSNGGAIVSYQLSELVSDTHWKRITVIIDACENKAYCFVDGALVGEAQAYEKASYENLALSLSGMSDGCAVIDNVLMRYFTEAYEGLDVSLSSGSLNAWADKAEEKRTENATRVVATVKNPATQVTTSIYSFSDLSAALVSDATVTLYADNPSNDLSINLPCTVYTNGYKLGASSTQYVATVDGDVISYHSGSITVNWVIDGVTTTEIYTGSTVATYKGTLDGTIYESANGDGTYSYYTYTDWSLTDGGAAIGVSDMVVTSENNTFYCTRKAYDGLFVTVKGSTVTGYTSARSLFTSAVLGGSFDRVSITNDFYYDSTGISDSISITKAFNLYLNGHTVTLNSTDISDHFFHANVQNGSFSIYGPGTLASPSTTSNLIYQGSGNVYIENVTLNPARAVSDVRQGYGHYRGCTFNMTGNAAAIGLINRNNVVTDVSKMPYVLIDDCVINRPSATNSSATFTLTSNSRIELNGGTVVNAKNGFLFSLSNSSVGTISSYDYANGTVYMQALIGDVYFDCTKLYSNYTNDPSGATYDMGDKISYCKGASFASKPDESILLLDGLIIAKRADANLPYVIASPADCATVIWSIGSVGVTEYWLDGTLPTPDGADVISAIESYPASDGYRYFFNTNKVSAGSSYTFTANEAPIFTVMANMTMHSGFDFNVYIPVSVDGIEFTGFTLDGVYTAAANAIKTTLSGVSYYKISKTNLAPHVAARALTLIIGINKDGVENNLQISLSVTNYAKLILERDDQTAEAKALIANILKYMESSYCYAQLDSGMEYEGLKSIYEQYKHLATASVVEREAADFSTIADGIYSATFRLANNPIYRFEFNSSYTGSISFTYTVRLTNGTVTTRTTTTNVVNGMANGLKYVEIVREPYELMENILITTASGSAYYNLAIYYHRMASELSALTNLLNSLFAYCETAKIYMDSLN